MSVDPAVERLHRALMETDGDPERLTDERLAEMGVTREQAREYAAVLAEMLEALENPQARGEALDEFVAHLLELRVRAAGTEDAPPADAPG
jgi:DNA repair ATPase RecN